MKYSIEESKVLGAGLSIKYFGGSNFKTQELIVRTCLEIWSRELELNEICLTCMYYRVLGRLGDEDYSTSETMSLKSIILGYDKETKM